MAKLAQLPANDRAPETAGASRRRVPRLQPRYFAFLSYSHKDKELADWLHRELEDFRVPRALAGRLTANGIVPRRLTPIFRDEHDLAAADDLGEEIKAALGVAISDRAVLADRGGVALDERRDRVVQARPARGLRAGGDRRGRAFRERGRRARGRGMFPAGAPPEIRPPRTADGQARRTARRRLPSGWRGRRIGFLKLVAGMLGVGLDELVQRETTRKHRRMAWLAAASLAGMAVTSTLAFTAFEARDAARDQRREAEGLIGFMLGDLKGKLEPIGRLDALDGVGARVLAYYQKLGTTDLSDAALSQRSRALNLMAQVADARGDQDGSLRLYREAMAGTARGDQAQPRGPPGTLRSRTKCLLRRPDCRVARRFPHLGTADARVQAPRA